MFFQEHLYVCVCVCVCVCVYFFFLFLILKCQVEAAVGINKQIDSQMSYCIPSQKEVEEPGSLGLWRNIQM